MILNDEVRVLDSLNNDKSLDLYHENLFLNDFQDFNVKLECKYYTESIFAHFLDSRDVSKNLLIMSINARSLSANFSNLKSFLDNINTMPDLIAIQETWKISTDSHNLPNYKLFCNIRQNGRGGGTAVYVKSLYHSTLIQEVAFSENIFEATAIQVNIPNVKKFICISLYRPNTHKELSNSRQLEIFFDEFKNLLSYLEKYKLPVYICTDMNIDFMYAGQNENANKLFDILVSFGYFNLISKCSRFSQDSNTLIDHIYTNDSLENVRSGLIIDQIADHCTTFCTIPLKSNKCSMRQNFCFKRSFSEFKKYQFKTTLSELSWNEVLNSQCPNESYNTFWRIFKDIFDLHFPPKRVKLSKNKQPLNKFMTPGLLKSRQTKLKLARKVKVNKSYENVCKFRTYRNLYNSVLRMRKAKYFQESIEGAENSRQVWKTINEALNKQNKSQNIDKLHYNDQIITDSKDIANCLNNHFATIANKVADYIPHKNVSFRDFLPPPVRQSIFFSPVVPLQMLEIVLSMESKNSLDVNDISFSLIQYVANEVVTPLSHIFNLSIQTGIFPDNMKVSKTIPIFKNSGSCLDPNNYRGISIVNSFSKIFEKLISIQLLKFLNRHNFFDDNQFGFLRNRSTNHALLKISNFITDAINKGEYALGIFLDVMKAFDSINHEILFEKLKNCGIRGISLDWFKSFLSGRLQKVKVDNTWSDNLLNISDSVLQGSILGVLLFIIFVNDLNNCSKVLLSVLFADDNSSLLSHPDIFELNKIANSELNKLCKWYTANKLAIHPEKSKFIIFKSSYDNLGQLPKVNGMPYFPLCINSNDEYEANITKLKLVKNVDSIKILGCVVDNNLSFSSQVQSIHSKISRNLYSLKQVSNLFPSYILQIIYYANIDSHINYCCNLLSMCNETNLKPLISIQKKAIRVVTKSGYRESTAPLFINLNILPMKQLIDFNSIIFMYDFVRNRLSNSFQTDWIRNATLGNHYNLRNADDFFIPRCRYEYLKSHPKIKFAKLWNDLPRNLKEIDSRNVFLDNLKEYLLAQV